MHSINSSQALSAVSENESARLENISASSLAPVQPEGLPDVTVEASSVQSSHELKIRIAELESECKSICDILDTRGQFVASAQMHDGWSGLHKTLSCWNDAIWWQTTEKHL